MVHLAKAVVKTQLKRSKRMLRGTILVTVTDMNRLVTQQMTQAQYHNAGPLAEELLSQVWEEYRGIFSKLKAEAGLRGGHHSAQDDRGVPGSDSAEGMFDSNQDGQEHAPARADRMTRSSRRTSRGPSR